MKAYILIRNEFCIYEYDSYFNEAVYLNKDKAFDVCEFSNKNRGWSNEYSGISFSVEEVEVQE